MSLSSFASAFAQANRMLALTLSSGSGVEDDVLLPYELTGSEGLSEGYTYHLDCLSSDASLELKKFIGVPAQISLLTDSNEHRALCGIITGAQQNGADGGFAKYRLTLQDPLAVLALRTNSRVFQDLSVREFVRQIIQEHRGKNEVFKECVDLDDQCTGKHPKQSWVTQLNETDSAFIKRWLAQEGISWYIKHGEDGRPGERPKITLVLFDNAETALKPASAPQVRYHRADGTEGEDSITDWFAERNLASGSLSRASHDYKSVQVDRQDDTVRADQGTYGNQLASTLEDYHYDTSHAANNLDDYQRYGTLRADAHGLASKGFSAAGSHRELAVGNTFELVDHPVHDQDSPEERQFALTRVELYARNNLPVDLIETGRRLDPAGAVSPLKAAAIGKDDRGEAVFRNRFDCVRKGVPIVPAFSQTEHAKPSAPTLIIGIVVGPEGEEIHTDALGRIKVRMPYTRNVDHDHAQGAGATDSDRDSPWIRVVQPWSGTEYGGLFIPRIGDEVLISYIGGDIDRPIVLGTVYNGTHRPATISDAGKLPGNRMLSALKSKMVKGTGTNEVVWDDTTQEQRIRVSTDHGETALNQGYLVHPRVDGKGAPRGEGFELRTDQYGALRATKGLLISTDPRERAKSTHLDSKELTTQMDGALEMSRALSEVAGGHNAETLAANSQTEHQLKVASKTYTQAGGTNQKGEVPGYEEPLLAFSSPAGIVSATPKTYQIAAGEHIHLSSQQDTNVAIGKTFVMAVKKAWSVFVEELDIKLFAGKGKVLIQAHENNIEATAKKDFKISSVAGNIEISTPNSLTLTAGGCQIKLSGGTIDIKAPGPVNIHGSVKNLTGPAGGNYSGVLPQMPVKKGDMTLQHLYENGEGIPASYKATLVGGEVRRGVLDAAGKATLAGIPIGGAAVEYTVEPRSFDHKPNWEPKLPEVDYGENASSPANDSPQAPPLPKDANNALAKASTGLAAQAKSMLPENLSGALSKLPDAKSLAAAAGALGSSGANAPSSIAKGLASDAAKDAVTKSASGINLPKNPFGGKS